MVHCLTTSVVEHGSAGAQCSDCSRVSRVSTPLLIIVIMTGYDDEMMEMIDP